MMNDLLQKLGLFLFSYFILHHHFTSFVSIILAIISAYLFMLVKENAYKKQTFTIISRKEQFIIILVSVIILFDIFIKLNVSPLMTLITTALMIYYILDIRKVI